MFKKFATGSFMTVVAASALLAVGCADSANKPYHLTGNQNVTPEQQTWIDQHSIDQKGHYNSVMAQRAANDVRIANERAASQSPQ